MSGDSKTLEADAAPPSTTTIFPEGVRQKSTDMHRRRQALRELSRSGRRLVQRRDDWAVMTAGSAAQLARLTNMDVAALAAEQLIEPAEGGGYTLCLRIGAAPRVAATETTRVETTVKMEVMKTGPWLLEAVGVARPKRKSAGFAGLALRARAGEGPMTLRQALAGLQLITDAEQSLRAERITMNWDAAAAADGRRRRARDGGLSHAARCAAAKLASARAAVGEDAWALAWGACVDGVAIQTLARRRDAGRAETRDALCAALEKLADAYDAA